VWQQIDKKVKESKPFTNDFKHQYNKKQNKQLLPPSDTFEQRKKKNTICFEPDYSPADLRVQMGYGLWTRFSKPIQDNDVIMVPALFLDVFKDINNSYKELMEEMVYGDFCAWHGNQQLDGTHWIMNDRAPCKNKSALFHRIVEKIAHYFNMDVHATRFNLYENGDEWKPYHFDAAAIDPEKARNQNITIGVSFGAERSIAFQHAKNGTRTEFLLPNGMCYAFGNKINTTWRHGIPPKINETMGRISIICWGFCNQNQN
tara:strand:+ start:7790 stop:8566 length:777 start_codon:yes stop_codon:yes gene_type:complete